MSISASGALADFFGTLQNPDHIADIKKYIMAFAGVAFSAAVIYVAATDPDANTDNFYLYSVFGILPVIIGIMIISPLFNGPMDMRKMMLFGSIFFTFLIAMYFFYRIMNPTSVGLVTNLLTLVAFLGLIIGLAIVYRIFVRSIVNSRGLFGFILKMLFLIPCLLMDALESIFTELKSAPRMVFVLFVLEILIVLAYIYLPRIFKVNQSNSVVLLNKPAFTSKKTVIGKSSQFAMDVNDINNPSKDPDAIRSHYSISMWMFINQHPTSSAAYSKETNIFRYGMIHAESGNPRISYFNDTSSSDSSDKYLLYPTSQDYTIVVPFDIPAQSWNHLVISYTELGVDLFVNGNLVKSIPLATDKLPKYNITDVVEIGDGDNTVTRGGLHGAICNVVYYKRPLTAFEIAADYNLNRYKNPPVNS